MFIWHPIYISLVTLRCLSLVFCDQSFGMGIAFTGFSEQDVQKTTDGKPYTILSYTNGPSWLFHRNGTARRNMTDDLADGSLGKAGQIEESDLIVCRANCGVTMYTNNVPF